MDHKPAKGISDAGKTWWNSRRHHRRINGSARYQVEARRDKSSRSKQLGFQKTQAKGLSIASKEATTMQEEFVHFLVIGWQAPNPLMGWRTWREVVPYLDPLFQAARKPNSIRMYQEDRESEDELRFGRLAWNEKSHQKWTHGSPMTGKESANWRFIGAEFWAPSPKKDAIDVDVDVFMNLTCLEPGNPDHHLTYDLGLHLLVSKQLPETVWKEAAPAAIRVIADKVRAIIVATREGTWLTPTGDGRWPEGPMEYVLSGIPRWVESSPSFTDFPPAAGWREL